eukprot:15350318-Ditylum_brightwellii.AAC.1
MKPNKQAGDLSLGSEFVPIVNKSKGKLTSESMYGKGSVHDKVAKIRNNILDAKGLNPSKEEDIALLQHTDYTTFIAAFS